MQYETKFYNNFLLKAMAESQEKREKIPLSVDWKCRKLYKKLGPIMLKRFLNVFVLEK